VVLDNHSGNLCCSPDGNNHRLGDLISAYCSRANDKAWSSVCDISVRSYFEKL
jgi:hypothetical protein